MKRYPEEIASALLKLAGEEKNKEKLISGLAWLSAAAETPLNHDYFEVLYSVLEKITEKEESNIAATIKSNIKYCDCNEGYKYGPDGKQLSNWDPDKNYGTDYVTVHFRMHTIGYYPYDGFKEEYQRQAFYTDISRAFSDLGWVCKEVANSCKGATWINGNESLHMHPQDICGLVQKNHVKRIAEALDRTTGSFRLKWVDLFNTVYDMSDYDYRKYLKSQECKIRNIIFSTASTRNRSIFQFVDDVVPAVVDKVKLDRIIKYSDKDIKKEPTRIYVLELVRMMVEEGYLISRMSGSIEYVRSINKKEQRRLGLVPDSVKEDM